MIYIFEIHNTLCEALTAAHITQILLDMLSH